jgi:YbbR domain-containing protein
MREFYNKYKIVIIALMIAAVLWLYVNYQEGNFQSGLNFSNNQIRLDIKYENLSGNLVVLDISDQTVVIEPEGYRFFNTYSEDDFEAYIDLDDVQTGDNVRVVNIRAPQGVNINYKDPSIVRVTVTSYKEEQSENNQTQNQNE